MKNKIAIIGSGISGLSSAYFALKKFPKHKVVLYGSREGGAINCYRDSFNNLQHGAANSIALIHGSRELLKLCHALGLLEKTACASPFYTYHPITSQVIPDRSEKGYAIYYDGKVRLISQNNNAFLDLLRFIRQHPRALLYALQLQMANEQQEQQLLQQIDSSFVQDFKQNLRVGPFLLTGAANFATQYIIEPILRTIYKFPPDLLSAQASTSNAFLDDYLLKFIPPQPDQNPEMMKQVQERLQGAQNFNFQGEGLQELTNALLLNLNSNPNFEHRFNTRVSKITFGQDDFRAIKISSRTKQEANFEQGKEQQLLNAIKEDDEIEYSHLVSTISAADLSVLLLNSLSEQEKTWPSEKFKKLSIYIPKLEKRPIVHINFDSSQYPSNHSKNYFSVSVSFNEELDADKDNSQQNRNTLDYETIAIQQVKDILNITQAPVQVKKFAYQNFFTIYSPGHLQRSLQILEQARQVHENFFISSNFLFSPLIPRLILQARATIEQLK